MKSRTTLTAAAALAVLAGAAAFYFQQRHNTAPEPAAKAPGPAAATAQSAAAPSPPVPAAAPATATRLKPVKSAKSGEPMLRIAAGLELGRVNGVVITLQDLLPLSPEEKNAERILTPERFQFLLQRAVDRELTFQTAKRDGVELTAAQQAALKEAAARRSTEGLPVFETFAGESEASQAAFEQRDFSALLLQASLAEKAGVPSRHVKEKQVLAYYQRHLAEYPALPDDPVQLEAEWAKIDKTIREKISAEVEATHHQQFDAYMERLRQAAQISSATIEQ